MSELIELLKRFNRKERFFLIGQALGNRDFTLSDGFRKCLGDEICIEIPPDALVAMDYHLDSVAASLWRYRNPKHPVNKDFPRQNEMITGTQQDIDLLIAFKEKNSEVCHLVFLEAKAYDSNYSDGLATWNPKEVRDQMQNKTDQLRRIFEADKGLYPEVNPYFCLISYSPPSSDELRANWPEWVKLDLPRNRLRVVRCNSSGKHDRKGDHFRIVDA